MHQNKSIRSIFILLNKNKLVPTTSISNNGFLHITAKYSFILVLGGGSVNLGYQLSQRLLAVESMP